MKILFELFVTFMKIGGFTFGGGYAMLPMIQKEVVNNKKWATDGEVLDYFAISQVTPPIFIKVTNNSNKIFILSSPIFFPSYQQFSQGHSLSFQVVQVS